VARYKILEPVLLSGEGVEKIDVEVSVRGGGFMGQAQAVRTAIARGIVGWTKNVSIKKIFIEYDRNLLINDSRRKEPKKFGRKGAQARRQKSYR
jgi:small subunit ribosomal protein S9